MNTAPVRQPVRPGPSAVTVADGVAIAASLAGLVVLYAGLWGGDARPTQARVLVEGREVLRVSLADAGRYAVDGPAGTTVLEVRDGRIRCVASPGPQHLCERAGWLAHAGEATVGLPNRVSIEVLGRDRRYDSVSY